MESKFRSLPLSIIDFVGVIIPGFAWLVLIITANAMLSLSHDPATPVTAWTTMSDAVQGANGWIGGLMLAICAIVIGYVAKPKAMHLASQVPIQIVATEEGHRLPRHGVIQFPFTPQHETKPYFKAVEALTFDLVGCVHTDLHGPQPFAIMKRLLRLVAPSLWEELEHREAEVRLLGSLFLASVFSGGLAVIEILRELAIVHGVARAAIMWLVASIVLAILIGDGFGHLRRREVEYTYLHTLLAVNAKRRGLLARRENEAE